MTSDNWSADYYNIEDGNEKISTRTVESNPSGMLTGVGLWLKTDANENDDNAMAIRANDHFETEKLANPVLEDTQTSD